MQKIKNKFIYFVVFLILLIILYSVYSSLYEKWIDRSSYVQLVDWEWTLNDIPLYINSREKLNLDDIVKTTSESALAIIEWWDGSITRVWWNSSLKINELYVSDNKDKLNIAFELFSWKTWSNVISFIPEESYFKQTFKDSEASVRWTIFNLDADSDYLYVLDHKVTLTNSDWKIQEVTEKKPIKLSDFSFIQLNEFIKWIRDSSFDEINRKLDETFIEDLRVDIQNKLEWLIELTNSDLSNISVEDKDKLYKELLSWYQDLNFISTDDSKELFDLKIWLKEKLLWFSPESEKELLIDSFVYDLKDSISNKDYDWLNQILTVLDNNKDYINLDVSKDVNSYLNKIDLQGVIEDSLLNNIETFKNTFTKGWEFDINDVKSQLDWLQDKAQNLILEWIDDNSSIIDSAVSIEWKAKDTITDSINNLLNK